MKFHLIRLLIEGIIIAAGLLFPIAGWAQTTASNSKDNDKIHVVASPEDMYIELDVPAHQIYLGETIRLEYDVYVAALRGQIFYDAEEPDFAHWYSIEGKAPIASSVTVDGKPYTREPFAVFFVTPNTTGKLSLPQLKVQIPYKEEKPWITHEPRMIEVIPFPMPVPQGFSNGNVGQFSIKAKISSETARVGDVLSIQAEITGNAPVSHIDIAPYQLKTNPEAFKIYPIVNESLHEQVINDRLISTKKYRLRILALKPGHWKIDPLILVYFDPQRHQYQTVTTQTFTISVTDSGITPDTDAPLATTKNLDEMQIVPIELRESRSSSPLSLWWMFVAPFLLLFVVVANQLKKRHQAKSTENKEKKIYMAKLNELLTAKSSDEQLGIIRKLFIMRYHVDIGRPTDQLAPKLKGIFSDEQIEVIVRILNELRMTSYSTQTSLDAEKLGDLVQILKNTKSVG